MITSIKVENNKRTPFEYLHTLKAFRKGTEFVFKPGVNVIIGKNGSGKSTLLNLIAKYTFCERSMCSEIPRDALSYPNIFDDENNVLDGVRIQSDYIGKVFHLLPHTDMGRDNVLDNIHNFSSYVNGIGGSSGEKGMCALDSLFNFMFSQKDYSFPIAKLKEYASGYNYLWKKRIDNLFGYYKNNHVDIKGRDFEYTFLMDEPDRNLDIDNIMQIYDVLSFHKPQTQVIAVIHNPSLIYKLSKLDSVHFVEMTKGYLKKVSNFMK